MTNNRYDKLLALGYSTREVEEVIENEVGGSYFANALAFIIESLNEEHTLELLKSLDEGSFDEFATIYNFTRESFDRAIESFRKAATREVLSRI